MAKYTLTYSTLLTKLQNWAQSENTTFTTELATVINLACIKLARDLNLEKFRRRSTGSFVALSPTIDMPTGAILIDAVLVDDGTDTVPMEERAGDVLEMYGGTGVPKYYTEQDTGTIRVGPTPDDAYDYVIYGLQRPEKLVAVDAETNWLTDNVPDLLFQTCMEWSSLFQKNEGRANVWRERRDMDLASAREEFGVASRNTDAVAPGSDPSTGKRTETQ